MKVLMISTDAKIFSPQSEVRRRMVLYGEQVERLDVIVLTDQGQSIIHSGENKLSDQVTVFSTNSRFKIKRLMDAFYLGFKFKPDVITCQDPMVTGLVGALLKNKLKTKLEIQIHTDIFSAGFINFSVVNRIKSILARFLIPQADGLRVVSERVKNNLYRAKIKTKTEPQVLPIFVADKKIKETSPKYDLHQNFPQFEKIILMSCRLEAEKNIPLAFKVLKLIKQNQAKIGLVIAGDGTLKDKLKKLAHKLDLTEMVVFLGWQEDLVSLYKTADLFLQTSFYEGYGLSLVEAVVAGCPVVSTDVGVAKEFGVSVISYNPEEIASVILEKLSSPPVLISTKIKLAESEDAYVKQIIDGWRKIL